jgi:aryl-alcohol dehydrogenase-like predicted oxidoreductase
MVFTPDVGQARIEECDDRHKVRRVIYVVRYALIFWRRVYPVTPGDHSPHTLRSIFTTSLQSLKRDKVRVLYLHAPDRSVPFEDTVREINKLYTEGRL